MQVSRAPDGSLVRVVQQLATLPAPITAAEVEKLAGSRQKAYNAISYARRVGAIERVSRGHYAAVGSD